MQERIKREFKLQLRTGEGVTKKAGPFAGTGLFKAD